MEELIAKIIEQSIVSGGFLFLLWHMVTKQEERMDKISEVLEKQLEVMTEMRNDIDELKRQSES